MDGERHRLARLARAPLAVLAIGMVFFALPTPAAAATTVTVSVNGHGRWAEVVATADKPRKFIFATSPEYYYHTCPNWDQAKVAFGGPTKLWVAPVADLEPDTLHYYKLEVIDPAGREPTSCLTGTFHTRKPSVTVSFDTIEVIDDGDSFMGGAGDLQFYLGTNGEFHDQLKIGPMEIDSGTTLQVKKSIVRTDFLPGHKLTMSVRAIEEDCDWGNFCSQGAVTTDTSPEKDNGHEFPYTWLTGHAGPFFVNVDDFDPDYSKPRPFLVEVKGEGVFHMKVRGTYKIAYD